MDQMKCDDVSGRAGLQESGNGPKQDYIFNIVSSMEPDKCTSTCLKLANIDKSMRDEGATTIQSVS